MASEMVPRRTSSSMEEKSEIKKREGEKSERESEDGEVVVVHGRGQDSQS